MMKWKFLVLCVLLCTTLISFAQEDENLIAVVLDGSNQDLLLVYSDGSNTVVELPIPDNVFLNGSTMTVSDDASYAAICWSMEPNVAVGNGFSDTYQLTVLELETGTLLLEQEYEDTTMCDASSFNDTGTQLAVATVSGTPPFNTDTHGQWALEIYDLESSDIVAGLASSNESTNPITNELTTNPEIINTFPGFDSDVPILADVQSFVGDHITFASIPFIGMGGIADVPAFSWSMTDGEITLVEDIGKLLGDSLSATGEVVFPVLNAEYAAAIPNRPVTQANEVHLFDGQREQVIYRNTDWVIMQTHFVNDGQDVAIILLEANDSLPVRSRIDVVSRNGAIQTLPALYANNLQVANNGNGAVILWTDLKEDNANITHLDVSDADGNIEKTLWAYQHQPPENIVGFSFPELVWSQPLPEDANYAPFTEYTENGVINLTPTPTSTCEVELVTNYGSHSTILVYASPFDELVTDAIGGLFASCRQSGCQWSLPVIAQLEGSDDWYQVIYEEQVAWVSIHRSARLAGNCDVIPMVTLDEPD